MKIERIKDKLETLYYNIKYGCINIIQWLPIVWNDRDWDHYYLMKLLEFKLFKKAKLFKKYGNHLDSNKQAKQLKKCAEIFKRLYEDEYTSESFIEHDKKWGNLKMSFEKIDKEFSEIIFNRKNIKTEEDKIKERHESNICWEKGYENQKKDLKEVFQIMHDNILSWWD